MEELLEKDKAGIILDIELGKGAYIGNGVKLGCNVKLGRNVLLQGSVTLGDNVFVDSASRVISKSSQTKIGNNVSIKGACIIRDSEIEDNCCIHHSILVRKKVEKGSCIKFYQPDAQIRGNISNL